MKAFKRDDDDENFRVAKLRTDSGQGPLGLMALRKGGHVVRPRKCRRVQGFWNKCRNSKNHSTRITKKGVLGETYFRKVAGCGSRQMPVQKGGDVVETTKCRSGSLGIWTSVPPLCMLSRKRWYGEYFREDQALNRRRARCSWTGTVP